MNAKNDFYREQAIRYGNNRSKIWRMINEIAKRKRTSRSTITSLMDREGRKLTEPLQIAKCLNEHFSTVGENMAEKFENLENKKDPISFITCDSNSSADFSPTNENEVKKQH